MGDARQESLGPPPGVGKQIGRYRIEQPIGMGGMASVFRAKTPEGETVAVKVLHPATVVPEDVKRFTREFEALARMDHPHIVRVLEAGVAENFPWIAMEFIDGEDLEDEVVRWRELEPGDRWQKVERVLRGLCEGLQYVHDKGLVHRDLKPTNVLLTAAGQPKISDFGVVKDPNATHTALTKAGRLVGTVAFMAPEQITGDPVDNRADLYSLGAVLYVMLTGKRPIEAKSVAGYLARHLTEVPKPPGQIDPSVPPRLEEICLRLLQKEPDRRYPSARAVLQTLDRPEGERHRPLRGRDEVMKAWGRKLAALGDGRGGVISITGPQGSGRTFVLDAMAEQAEAQGLPVTRAVADGTPLKHHLAPAFAHEQPSVVLVDDLDQAPAADIDGLAHLVREALGVEQQPVLVVFTATSLDGRLATLAAGTTTGQPAIQLALDPLDRFAVVQILRDRGITGPAAPVLGRRLHADFHGLPGAIEQQLRALFDTGWLEEEGDGVAVRRPVKELRRCTLPIPEPVRQRLEATIADLSSQGREIAEVLALLDRPASAGLIERCVSDPTGAARVIDRLVRTGLLRREGGEARETLGFAHPCAPVVVRDLIDDDQRRVRHGAIADALSSRRRRGGAREVATHRMLAGNPSGAYPMFVRAARRASRAGLFLEVLSICETARSVRDEAEADLSQQDLVRYRRWLALLEGEAQLARGRWDDAVEPLERAIEAARGEEDSSALARCLGSLGRAHYRRGHFDEAAPLLEQALEESEPGAPERASATRALADIRLRAGRFADAEELWQEALEIAEGVGSRDGEARARRGLAHVAALRGQLTRSAERLDAAEDLLKLGGDDRVRAGVMARSLELDIVSGRYGSALHRAEALIDLVRAKEMASRMPEAFALHAEALLAVGERDESRAAAGRALTYARAQGGRAWDARLRAARVLAGLGDATATREALPEAEFLPASQVDDPSAQRATLQARSLAGERPMDARDLAHWALVRPKPMLPIRAARIALDASLALSAAGDADTARTAAKRGLRSLEGPGADGLRLGLLLALHRAHPDPRVLRAAGQLAQRILESLPAHLSRQFRRRPGIEEALAAGAP